MQFFTEETFKTKQLSSKGRRKKIPRKDFSNCFLFRNKQTTVKMKIVEWLPRFSYAQDRCLRGCTVTSRKGRQFFYIRNLELFNQDPWISIKKFEISGIKKLSTFLAAIVDDIDYN